MRRRLTASATAAAIALAAVIGSAPSAGATESTQIVQGQYLRIVSQADWGPAGAMESGASVRWDLVVSAHAPGPGTVRLGVSASGGASLLADVRLCDTAWREETCPAGERTLRTAWTVPRDGRTVELAASPADTVAYLRLDVRLAPGSPPGSTEIRVHAEGFGDELQTGPLDGLPATGGSVPVAALIGGGALVVAAATLVLVGRRRRGGAG